MTLYDLNKRPEDLPEAMARATRIGRMDAMECRPQLRATKAVTDRVAPGCAYGFANPLKQAYNAGYWSASIVMTPNA